MKHRGLIALLFVVAALYDGLIGLAFLAAGPTLFDRANVTPPNHWGYVQFPAALLIVFSLMFLAVAVRPQRNRNLIPYGILLKVAYSSVVFYYWAVDQVPMMWKPFAVADVVFLVLFLWAYAVTGDKGGTQTAAGS